MEREIRLKDLFVGSAKSAYIEFFRSLFVGGAAFVADFFVLTLLKECAGLDTLVSATLGFAVGVTVNYLMSAFWAFRSSNIKNPYVRFAIFIAIAIIGLLLNNAIIAAFDGPFAEKQLFGSFLSPERYYMIGKVAATVIVFFWNFISRKVLLFRSDTQKN